MRLHGERGKAEVGPPAPFLLEELRGFAGPGVWEGGRQQALDR